MLSLPIPSKDSMRYSDLKATNGSNYSDLMKQLSSRIIYNKERLIINNETKCHLDPDLNPTIINRLPGWRHCFGSAGPEQSHLKNQEVCEGDLFLFFGWFRKTICENDHLIFDHSEGNLHVIYGYFQIDEILEINERTVIPPWLAYHPHVADRSLRANPNTIYIARKNLSLDESLPGGGLFNFREDLVLTKPGLSRSRWKLPSCFEKVPITYHKMESRKKEGYFQSAMRGQEFVIKNNEEIEEWTKTLISGMYINAMLTYRHCCKRDLRTDRKLRWA